MDTTQKKEEKPRARVNFKLAQVKEEKNNPNEEINKNTFSNFEFHFDRTKTINNFYTLMLYLSEVMTQDTENITELDYRLKTKHPHKDIAKLTLVEKYQLIGKIGSNPTHFDINSYYNNSILSYHKSKIWLKKRKEFSSCRTNNCLVSGKWCYEVVMLSNGLLQIGFGQLMTPNTETNGIGDDNTSFGYDGYRKVVYHILALSYGKIWDIGDVIGVCIDLTNKRLEYFVNGVSCGFVYEGEVQTGKNIAYFPALSGSQEEKILFNFGEVPFYYNYKGYEPIDIMKSRYDNSLNSSAKLMNILDCSLLDLLSNHKNIISNSQIKALNKMIFSYLINVSFRDLFISKELLFPFIANLLKRDEEKFNQFLFQIENYFRNTNKAQRKPFYSKIMGRLCDLAEEYSLLGANKIKQWGNVMELIINLICKSHIFKKWLKSPKISFHLSLLFNSNTIHMNKILETILVQSKKNKFSRSKQLKNLIQNSSNFYPDSSLINEEIYSKTLSKFIFGFIHMNKKLEKSRLGFDILLRTLKGYYYFNQINKCEIQKMLMPECKPIANIIKNFIYNYMQMFFDNFSNLPFNKLEEDPFVSNILKSLIHMLPFVNNYLITYNSYYKYAKALPDVGWEFIKDTSTIRLESIYRNFFHFFNGYSQRILYQFSFYLSQYFLYCLHRSSLSYDVKEVLFPGIIAKCLYKYYSKTLKDVSLNKKLNSNSSHFSSTSYSESIISLYCELLLNKQMFKDKDHSKLIMKYLGFLLKKPFFTKDLFSKTEITKKIVNLIIFYIPDENYSKPICNIIGKVMELSNRQYFTELFSSMNTVALHFISTFSTFCLKYVEEKMNKYILNFNSTKTKGYEQYDYIHLMWHKRGYSCFCKALNVYSFAILLTEKDPKQALNNFDSLIFIKLKLLLINVTSRLLNKATLDEYNKLKDRYLIYYDKPYGLSLGKILTAVSGLFDLFYSKQKELNDLELKIAYNDSIEINSFNSALKNFILNDNPNFANNVSYVHLNLFGEMIQRILEKREIEIRKREEDKIRDESEDDNKCILCFVNLPNKMILPCRHAACNECISVYIQENKSCFICRGKVEEIVDKV